MPRPGASRRASIFVVLTALALCAPSANTQIFAGLPLSQPLEFVFGLGLAPMILSRGLRRMLDRWVGRWRPRVFAAIVAALLAVIAFKVLLYASGDYTGLIACYRSSYAAPLVGTCESSYENLLRRFGATRLDTRIDFEEGRWNLSFWNSNRFNAYGWAEGTRIRGRLPLSGIWRGGATVPRPATMLIDYVGDVNVSIGGRAVHFGPTYSRVAQASLPVVAGPQSVLIEYEFDDGARVGRPLAGPPATFKVHWEDDSGSVPVTLGRVGHSTWRLRAVAVFADLLMAAAGLTLAAFYVGLFARDRWLALAAAALAIAAALWPATNGVFGLYIPNLVLLVTGWTVLTLLIVRRHSRHVTFAFFALVAVLGTSLISAYGGIGTVRLRTAGGDFLTYESFAHAMFDLRSLSGDEFIFYYQPLFRYVLLAERLIVGDSDFLLFVLIFAVWLLAIALGIRRALIHGRRGALAGGIAGALMMLLALSGTPFIGVGVSEYPTWIMMPLAIPMLFASRRRVAAFGGVAMLAATAITRLNNLPGAVGALGVWAAGNVRRRPGRAVVAVALFAAILLLPLAHNLHYGKQALLFTSDTALWNKPFEKLFSAPGSSARQELVSNWRAMSGLDLLPWHRVAVHGLQAVWLVTIAALVVRRRASLRSLAIAGIPVLFIGVLVLVRADLRDTETGYLVMGAVTALLAARAADAA